MKLKQNNKAKGGKQTKITIKKNNISLGSLGDRTKEFFALEMNVTKISPLKSSSESKEKRS